jgi:hypothetical protein
MWIAGLFIVGFGVGLAWDRAWHATHPFEDFWSPPHLFIYATHAVAMAVVARIVASPALRACFGPAVGGVFPLSPLPWPLALLVGGFVVILTAGFFDSIWHTRFGLDETGWSFPHAMLGWGILLGLLGLVSARLALAPHRPLAWYARLFFGLLLLTVSVGTVLGPLGRNQTPDLVRSVASLPVLASEPDAQRTFRIYLEWNLTRLHPVFGPLAALASGVGLALARGMDRRWWFFPVVAALGTVLAVSGERREARFYGLEADPRTWLPVPYLAAALTVSILRVAHVRERWCWIVAGLPFGVLAILAWGASPALVLVAGPALLAGASIGDWIFRVLERPTGRGVLAVIGLLGLGIPLVSGIVDLFLRARTP